MATFVFYDDDVPYTRSIVELLREHGHLSTTCTAQTPMSNTAVFSSMLVQEAPAEEVQRKGPAFGSDRPYLKRKKGRS